MGDELSHYFPRFPPLITNAEYFSVVDIIEEIQTGNFPVTSYT